LVRRFTTPTANIIKLIPSDAGRPITDIAREIEYPQLADDAREVLRTLVYKERLVTGTNNRWFTVRIMPYRTVENVIDGVVITFTDASATQRIEAGLRKQANELRQMVNAFPHLAWGCDAEGTCDYFSAQWLEYTGATAAELQGYGWLHAVHPDDRESVRQKWRAAIEAGTALDVELRMRAKDGNYRWFRLRSVAIRDADGNVVRWYGTNSDIHGLKVAADQRQSATARMIKVLENVNEPFLVISDGETVNYANRAAQRLLGAEPIVGKRLTQVLPEAATSAFREKFREVARDGSEVSFEAQFKQSLGNDRFNVRIFPNTEGIALLFQPRVREAARSSDGTVSGRNGE
jgi:PAS domain S-box-containing protein